MNLFCRILFTVSATFLMSMASAQEPGVRLELFTSGPIEGWTPDMPPALLQFQLLDVSAQVLNISVNGQEVMTKGGPTDVGLWFDTVPAVVRLKPRSGKGTQFVVAPGNVYIVMVSAQESSKEESSKEESSKEESSKEEPSKEHVAKKAESLGRLLSKRASALRDMNKRKFELLGTRKLIANSLRKLKVEKNHLTQVINHISDRSPSTDEMINTRKQLDVLLKSVESNIHKETTSSNSTEEQLAEVQVSLEGTKCEIKSILKQISEITLD